MIHPWYSQACVMENKLRMQCADFVSQEQRESQPFQKHVKNAQQGYTKLNISKHDASLALERTGFPSLEEQCTNHGRLCEKQPVMTALG